MTQPVFTCTTLSLFNKFILSGKEWDTEYIKTGSILGTRFSLYALIFFSMWLYWKWSETGSALNLFSNYHFILVLMYPCSNFSILAYTEIFLPTCVSIELIEHVCNNYVVSHLHCVFFINTCVITCSMQSASEYFTRSEMYLLGEH